MKLKNEFDLLKNSSKESKETFIKYVIELEDKYDHLNESFNEEVAKVGERYEKFIA